MQDVRQCSLNLNYWWTVAHLKNFSRSGIKAAKVGTIELVVVKANSSYSVFEDACPHKRVRLSKFGRRVGNKLVCSYHGWKFAPSGQCTDIPGMDMQKQFCLKSYPVKEYGGWLWVFLGDEKLVDSVPLPKIPPVHSQHYHPIPMQGEVGCHFSYITENATDLFHADLHQSAQPWANPKLLSLKSNLRTVNAIYEVDTPRLLAALISHPGKNRVHVMYEYPYFHLWSEDGAFYLFVVYVPTEPQRTWVYSTFYFRHVWGMPWILKLLHPILDKGTFRQVFAEDIRAVQEEQRAYNLHSQDLSRETNPVSYAVRKVILNQTDGQQPLTLEPFVYEGKPV
ncbi:Rieske 2Fe-2S domain-containing protein [Chlorogloea sp. CCALA 695]|uniref:Rieske 2Fe-2S domain-containing protein n=1 Tax=Chlorogloea sp. CCALA 695 TaxID=2107693 RepID=UPI000D053F90|nr:Rieske 2Fe-2S domain-containing protein [Chlorogloea sp. CCALA 695]PSB30313.1 hypothetical protein C7B70_16645 [Chlorogloea sp. CCALA 695]